MKKIISVSIISILIISVYAQNSINQKIQYLQSFLYQYSLYENKSDCKLWVNKAECQVEIGYTKFNLNDIKMTYRFHEQDKIHLVGFVCKLNENCIDMTDPSNGNHSFGNGYYFGFKTKQGCYTFMELIGDLRNTLNKYNGN